MIIRPICLPQNPHVEFLYMVFVITEYYNTALRAIATKLTFADRTGICWPATATRVAGTANNNN